MTHFPFQVENAIRLLLIFLFFVFPTFLFSQKKLISVDFQNEKIEDVLIDLATENGYEIVFNSSYFSNQKISLQENNQPLFFILQQILADTKVDISIKGKKIILTKRRKVFGYIIDKNSGEALISATIYDPKSGIGTLTNDFGFFSLDIPFEHQFVVPSYVGYNSDSTRIDKVKFPITIKMESSGSLSEIIVTKDEETIAIEQELGKKDLITNDIKTLFATGGEPDVFQYLYTQPGITTGPDGLGGVHVRGGDVSHNLFLYDGVKVYVPFHSLGLFSVFDANQLKHANFSKYGFNPRHGGRLSSVLEMNVKEGDVNKWNTNVSFSTLATHVGLDGPIVKDKVSLSLYARRTHLDPLIKNFTTNKKLEEYDGGFSNHFFFDVNAKLHAKLGERDKISLTMYSGKDEFEDEIDILDEDEFSQITDESRNSVNWQNQLAVLKWNHLYNNQLFSNATISYTNYKYQSNYWYQITFDDFEFPEDNYEFNNLIRFFSNITEFGADIDFDFFPNKNHHITFGAGYHDIIYRPGVGEDPTAEVFVEWEDDEDFYYFDENLENAYASQEAHIYINDKWRIRKNLHLNFGGRYARFNSTNLIYVSDGQYNVFQANLSLRWLIMKNLSTTLSFDRTEQPVHLLSASNIGFPNDLWIPSIQDDIYNIKPAKAHQVNLGFNFRLFKNLNVSVDGYYKEMSNLLKFYDLSSLPSLSDFLSDYLEDAVTSGNGTSQGIELEANYQTKKFKSSIAYTLSKTDRTFEELNENQSFPFEFDQRHKLTINLYQKLGKQFWLYANWNYFKGLNQTLYQSEGYFSPLENFYTPPEIRLSSLNGNQLPDYHRLDLGIVWRKETSQFNHELNLGVQNIYNRRNIFFTYEDVKFNELRESSALPILPSLMYKIGISGK